MSVGFQMLVAFILFLGALVGGISFAVFLLKRRFRATKNSFFCGSDVCCDISRVYGIFKL